MTVGGHAIRAQRDALLTMSVVLSRERERWRCQQLRHREGRRPKRARLMDFFISSSVDPILPSQI